MSPECFGIQGFFVFLHRGYAFRLLADANRAPSKGREAEGDIIKKVEIKQKEKYVAKRFVDLGGRGARPLGRRPTHRGGGGRGRAAPRAPDSHRTDHCRPGHLHARALRQRRLRPQGHPRPGRGQRRGKQYLQRPAHRWRGRPRGSYDDPALHGLQGRALRPRGLGRPTHDVSERLGHHRAAEQGLPFKGGDL